MLHTCFVSITDRATDSLSGASCVLLRPWFRAPISICNSLNWYLVKPGGLCVIPWLCPTLTAGLWLIPGCCVDNLKRQDELSRLVLLIHTNNKLFISCTSTRHIYMKSATFERWGSLKAFRKRFYAYWFCNIHTVQVHKGLYVIILKFCSNCSAIRI